MAWELWDHEAGTYGTVPLTAYRPRVQSTVRAFRVPPQPAGHVLQMKAAVGQIADVPPGDYLVEQSDGSFAHVPAAEFEAAYVAQ
jgi:hypothetical protein